MRTNCSCGRLAAEHAKGSEPTSLGPRETMHGSRANDQHVLSEVRMAAPAEPLIDVHELARRLGVSHWWIRRYVQGRGMARAPFPVHRVGRYVRFDYDEVRAW